MKLNKVLPIALGLGFAVSAFAENPIIQTYYSPDPAPVVFGDTVCVYTGNDEGGSFFTMHGWRVSCSTDMVNWTDKGELILSNENFGGNAKPNGDWAAQVIRRNGKYYYYVTVESTRGGRAINVAVADRPEGPFKDARNGQHLAGPDWAYIDPTVWIDDDGQAYLYWGNPRLYWAKLKENMIEFDGKINTTNMDNGFSGGGGSVYTEGPWIHKRNNKYYMLYASHGTAQGEKISYSTSDGPTGPWKWGGIIMEPGQGNAFTNHCGIIDFKGRSFFFYHNQKNVGGGGYSRSTAVEEFTWNADGSIPQIKTSDNGVVKPIKNLDPFERVEAETKSWVGGINVDRSGGYTIIKHVAKQGDNVYLTNMNDKFYTKVRSVDMGDGAEKIIVCTKGNGGKMELHAKSQTGPTLATIDVPKSSSWQETSFDLTDAAGVEDLFFVVKQGGFDFDYWYMESEKTKIPQEPFKGVASAIPGKIEAEDYDKGGHNKAFYDNDRANQGGFYREDEVDIVALDSADTSKGYAIGYTEDGEWVEYTVNNQIASEYTIVLNVATASEDVGVKFYIDDNEITDVIKAPQGDDWITYSEVKAQTKEIPAGEHVLKMEISGNFVNIDWIKFCTGDCKEEVSLRGMRVELPISEKSYSVFSMTGKHLGYVEAKGQSLAKSIRSAGYVPGVYMVRGVGHSKTFRVLVK